MTHENKRWKLNAKTSVFLHFAYTRTAKEKKDDEKANSRDFHNIHYAAFFLIKSKNEEKQTKEMQNTSYRVFYIIVVEDAKRIYL